MKRLLIYLSVLVVAIGLFVGLRLTIGRPAIEVASPVAPPSTTESERPSITATTGPATAPIEGEKVPPVDVLSLVKFDDPDYPTTQPLDLPAELPDAAKIVIDGAVYLDPFGRLWIEHPAGRTIKSVVSGSKIDTTMIVRECPVYVHYPRDGGAVAVVTRAKTAAGPATSQGVSPSRESKATDDTITVHGRYGERTLTLESPCDWARATPVGEATVVPTSEGYAVVTGLSSASPKVESHRLSFPTNIEATADKARATTTAATAPTTRGTGASAGGEVSHTRPVVVSTGVGALVWAPWENGRSGSTGADYIADGKVVHLNAAGGWPGKIIQLIPLQDGSVQVVAQGDKKIVLSAVSLAAAQSLPADLSTRVDALAKKLADRDPRVRTNTQRELEQMGAGIFPRLTQLRPTLPLEARRRVEQILGQQFAPKLAGLTPLPGLVHVAARFDNGGCVLMLTGGGLDEETGVAQTIIPAWVAIRPGRFVERLPPAMVSNFVLGRYRVFAAGNEWVVADQELGPRRWMNTRLTSLLPKKYRMFDRLIGIDRSRRWIFQSTKEEGKTLLIDPSLPDTTPKFPVWKIDSADEAGWTDTGWPVVRRDKRLFVLAERNWRLLDENTEKFIPAKADVRKPGAGEAAPPTAEFDALQATDGNGRTYRYSDGRLTMRLPDGTSTETKVNARNVSHLFVIDGHLFLIAPAKVVRLRLLTMPTVERVPVNTATTQPADGSVPATNATASSTSETSNVALKVEAEFTGHLPGVAVERVWVDPAGRIIYATPSSVWVAFPGGMIHPDLVRLMLTRPDGDE